MNPKEAERLMELYLSGELSGAERSAFADALLEDQDLYNIFAEEQILSELLSTPEVQARAKLMCTPQPYSRGSKSFPRFNWRWAIASAALMLSLVAAMFLSTSRQGRRTGAGGAAALAQQGANTKGEAPSFKTGPEVAQNAPGRDKVLKEPTSKTRLAPLITLMLVPTERSPGSGNRIVLPHEVRTIVLIADIDTPPPGNLSAILAAPGRGAIGRFDNLRVQALSSELQRVRVPFSSNLLAPGEYTLTFYGATDKAHSDSVAEYSFSVLAARH